jgi:hypothetical protein
MGSSTIEVDRAAGVKSVRSAGERRGGAVAMWWGILGVALLFVAGAVRLGERGLQTVRGGLEPVEWLALVVLTAVFVYGEGVRALQRRYVPHVMRRVEQLRQERRCWYRMLAPLHALTLIGAGPGLLARAWGGTAAIGAAVVIVRSFPEPWRGITGVAVAAALAWGTCALLVAALRSLRPLRSRRSRRSLRAVRAVRAARSGR